MSKPRNNQIPTNPYNDNYSSLIRPIKIFLPNRDDDGKKSDFEYVDFVGRERLMERLFNWLSDKQNEKGSYLVTGFRGMGKTSLVERVTNRLTREVNERKEPWWLLLTLVPSLVFGIAIACLPQLLESDINWWLIIAVFIVTWFIVVKVIYNLDQNHFIRKKKKARKKYPNQEKFDDVNVDKMARGKNDDYEYKNYRTIKISVNLGHEVLRERDVLSMIATSVKEKYKSFVKSAKPHLFVRSIFVLVISFLSIWPFMPSQTNLTSNNQFTINEEVGINIKNSPISIREDVSNVQRLVVSGNSDNSNNQQVIVNGESGGSGLSHLFNRIANSLITLYGNHTGWGVVFRFFLYVLLFVVLKWLLAKLFRFIPYYSSPIRALQRLETLTERLNTITGEETGMAPSAQNSVFTFSLFSRRRHKTKPIADIREIETELSEIINMINSDKCLKDYRANFIVVFDEMDKIDPAMMEQHKATEMPEFTDSVKGFPDGMDSRERRRNVLKLLANIKLFVSTAKAKFVFISGRELYDAYLADLSDRDFAISSIFSGVINIDSFLTPEGGQTDVRSMSEWYIANRLIPDSWLKEKERLNAEGVDKSGAKNRERAAYKKEMPSLRWYYEYLIETIDKSVDSDEEKDRENKDALYVIGFLHTFAAYLTHISNGSPKKIFLYFDKYIRYAKDCLPMNDWNDVCSVGWDYKDKDQKVLYFEPIQQKTINFVYYLSNPIMGAVTNDMSNYGDRFLVSLSFIIDHIYKYHNRSFSWRNLEQIPDLLKTSKAPELRDEMTSIMEYLSQIHISPILIGLNEYKFHKSIAEEISVMSRMSDEASAIFNFTLDESLSVIQYNTRLLNYYIELDKERNDDKGENPKHRYLPLIARIHSNLGDLHFWDEDYYSATLEYRAAIETLPDNKEDESGFLTRIRCMLKLGLAYELRKLYPNAYQTYCRLINLLIKKRWVNENDFGLSVMDARMKGWQDKRQVMVNKNEPSWYKFAEDKFEQQFKRPVFNGDHNNPENEKVTYSLNFDGIIKTFARDLTVEKTQTINTLTLFEEIRYLYQSILAKLSILEKMGMSGITQTNIEVAEGEFRTIHKSVNFREKFIIAADFFRKLAEILYYKNSLTILTKNQDSFYVSVYYDDYDLLANVDDFCMCKSDNALTVKHDIHRFFYLLDNDASDNKIKLSYPNNNKGWCTLTELYQHLKNNLHILDILGESEDASEEEITRIKKNVGAYFEYSIKNVATNKKDKFYFGGVNSCNHHSKLLRKNGLRTSCYACKYYTRSLRILADNMFNTLSGIDVLDNPISKSLGILKRSFKNELLYTNSTNIRALAQTLEGFGNVMYACASGDDCEGVHYRPGRGISVNVIKMLQELCNQQAENDERKVMEYYEKVLSKHTPLSRLDKSILYYWDAYRFYLMDTCYNDAVGCLNKILNILVYYMEVVCYYGTESKALLWKDETDTIAELIGDNDNSFVATLFKLITRYTSYKYDFTNLDEINEQKWIFSKEMRDNIDLTKLSVYPAIRSAWLRVVEIRAKGLRFLAKNRRMGYEQTDYVEFIKLTYPLVAPQRRYETTFYEEVMGYYTKMRYNDHIMNNLVGGNPMIDRNVGDYSNPYHITFYEKLYSFLASSVEKDRLDYVLFGIEKKDVKRRLELIEFLIHDTLVCITDMVNVFTPHNHLTSYSKSFVGLVYNFYWEWSRKFEFLYSLYQYQELMEQGRREETEKIINNIWGSGSIQSSGAKEEHRERLRQIMTECGRLISRECHEAEQESKFGSRSDRLYERLRHDIDDITINTIYSNYTAEMALKYYQMAEEANTEGEAYREMIGALHFLNDDLNNDTCQFNIACDRFLLNTGVVSEQRRRLEKLYKNSNVYNLRKGYIDGPNAINNETIGANQFDRSQFINSEY